jgi:hypothetical protein
MRYRVNQNTLALIALADEVIARIRYLVPHGAGNQTWNNERTRGWAQWLTDQAQMACDLTNNWTRPSRVAGAVLKFGAGNCQDQASVAYLLLRELLPPTLEASYCVANKTHHSFAAIGVPNSDPDDKVVIVDAWPEMAQAVLWKHHFCRRDSAFSVLRHKAGGKTGKLDRSVAKYDFINFDKNAPLPDYDWNTRTKGNWNHRWCVSNAEVIIYYSNEFLDKTSAFFRSLFK